MDANVVMQEVTLYNCGAPQNALVDPFFYYYYVYCI